LVDKEVLPRRSILKNKEGLQVTRSGEKTESRKKPVVSEERSVEVHPVEITDHK